jgi:hypothetical protein
MDMALNEVICVREVMTRSVVGIVSMADVARHSDETQLGDTEKAITHA